MSTYKKRGQKKSRSINSVNQEHLESTTAELFNTLETSASKTEQLVSKYQNLILISIVVIALSVLCYLGYRNYIHEPRKIEAVGELSQAQYYFELAINSDDSDSLFLRALNGGDGKYGFLDIIENYAGTPAGMLANYSAGMSYLNLKDYVNAINYLDIELNKVYEIELNDKNGILGLGWSHPSYGRSINYSGAWSEGYNSSLLFKISCSSYFNKSPSKFFK